MATFLSNRDEANQDYLRMRGLRSGLYGLQMQDLPGGWMLGLDLLGFLGFPPRGVYPYQPTSGILLDYLGQGGLNLRPEIRYPLTLMGAFGNEPSWNLTRIEDPVLALLTLATGRNAQRFDSGALFDWLRRAGGQEVKDFTKDNIEHRQQELRLETGRDDHERARQEALRKEAILTLLRYLVGGRPTLVSPGEYAQRLGERQYGASQRTSRRDEPESIQRLRRYFPGGRIPEQLYRELLERERQQ